VIALVRESRVYGQVWSGVDFVRHADYQAVDGSGSSTYGGTAPFRMIGVVLNQSENWLEPTENYSETPLHFGGNFGGQSEIMVQAVDLDGTAWDPYPAQDGASDPLAGDFGGSFVYMAQNYGNLPFLADPGFNYIDQDMTGGGETRPVWYDELDRLGLFRPGTTLPDSQIVRAGDLVEIQARVNGLVFEGKHNVNERHDTGPANDFEIVILEKGFGLPEPAQISLADLKDAADNDIFDETRATGGERYQSTLVEIQNVRLQDDAGWASNADLVLVDDTGRSLPIHLGLDDAYDSNSAPSGYFNVTGILDQKDPAQLGGYRVLALDYSGITPVPEPSTLMLAALGAVALGALRNSTPQDGPSGLIRGQILCDTGADSR